MKNGSTCVEPFALRILAEAILLAFNDVSIKKEKYILMDFSYASYYFGTWKGARTYFFQK
jgi:hypothetical protein